MINVSIKNVVWMKWPHTKPAQAGTYLVYILMNHTMYPVTKEVDYDPIAGWLCHEGDVIRAWAVEVETPEFDGLN